MYKAKTGVVRYDGFHPKVPMVLDKRNKRINFGILTESGAEWQVAATSLCTTMFFLIPKNVTSERPIAVMPTLIRWWESSESI